MSEDYLWDGSGEADPELLYLEQTLGTLRYKSDKSNALPLEPMNLPFAVVRLPQKKRLFFSAQVLVIAASVLLMLMAGGIYLLLPPAKFGEMISQINDTKIEIKSQPSVPEYNATPPSKALQSPAESVTGVVKQPSQVRLPGAHSARAIKTTSLRRDPNRDRTPEHFALASAERARGEEAKNKLMLALRIASLELRDVRRRVYTEDASVSSSQKK